MTGQRSPSGSERTCVDGRAPVSPRAVALAAYAITPFGRGDRAFPIFSPEEPAPVAISIDAELVSRGLSRPFSARVDGPFVPRRARSFLSDALAGLLETPELRDELRGRVAFLVGTSSGAMEEAEQLFRLRKDDLASPEDYAAATYFAPFVDARASLEAEGLNIAYGAQIVTACAASTWAVGLGLRLLERGAVDAVIAGGYDAQSLFVAAGFEALRATTASRPAPFRLGRDGMSLGEGAGFVVLKRETEAVSSLAPRWLVSGFGASTDAVHVTAPDRTGGGLYRAASAAIADSGLAPSDLPIVSAHGTSTPFNDAMETKAIASVFGQETPIVHPFKSQIGHTLGAAGILETLALGEALRLGIAPATATHGEPDPETPVRLLETATPVSLPGGLKLSAAFGGVNAALVLERAPSPNRRAPQRNSAVHVSRPVQVTLPDCRAVADVSGIAVETVARMDEYSVLLATAVALLRADIPFSRPGERAARVGLTVGHALATLDLNERYFLRILERGPASAEPRLFPPTSPNLVAGQVAIVFGLGGPSAAFASGPGGGLDPLWVACELVRAGDADAVVVGAVDVIGPASAACLAPRYALQTGATAVYVSSEPHRGSTPLEDPIVLSGFGQGALFDAVSGLGRR